MTLLSFIVHQRKEPKMREKLGEKTQSDVITFVSRSVVIKLLKSTSWKHLRKQKTVIFHANHAAPKVSSIFIVAEEIDITFLCLVFQKEMNFSMYVTCGTR